MNIYFDFPLIWCLEEITVYAGGNQLCSHWSEADKLVQPTERTQRQSISCTKSEKKDLNNTELFHNQFFVLNGCYKHTNSQFLPKCKQWNRFNILHKIQL